MDNLIQRTIQQSIEKALFKGKIIVLYGARQVGKTTLVQQIIKNITASSRYFNCDEPDIRSALTDKTSTELKSFLGGSALVVIDEAQRVKNIGITLKLLIDTYPDMHIIATGSSLFDLSNKIVEPLTGRKYEFYLYPCSLHELYTPATPLEIDRLLERRIIFGMYPEIVQTQGNVEEKLKEITRSYLFRDIMRFDRIKNSEAVEKLLQALALQIGNEVSYNELATLVGINKRTVQTYMQILEKSFIIFRLQPLSRNLRNELKKLRKIYFYDTGIRNALINNFNPLELRQDVGALWENFILSERIKYNHNNGHTVNMYFWRTTAGAEIDYVEERDGTFHAFECKWNKDTYKPPTAFMSAYPQSTAEVINKQNYKGFVGL